MNLLINPDAENSIKNLLSLLAEENQMAISISLIEFFKTSDLINILDVLRSRSSNKRDVNREEVVIYRYIGDEEKEIEIKDILLLNHSPALRYIEIIFRLSPTIDYSRYKYYYYPDIINLLCKILCESINYSNFCKRNIEEGYKIKRKHLYTNFARSVAYVMKNNYNILMDFKYIINLFISPRLFNSKEKFYKVYNISSYIHLDLITITDTIVKFSVTNNNESTYIYLDRNLKGMATLKLILELILRYRKYEFI